VISCGYHVGTRKENIGGVALTYSVYFRGIFAIDDDKICIKMILDSSEIRAQISNTGMPDDVSDCKNFQIKFSLYSLYLNSFL
jgi:hypothetical protein